jgi:transposase
MSTHFSASTSQKSDTNAGVHGQIVTTEEQEKTRVQQELKAMQAEEEKLAETLSKNEAGAEQKAKDEATKILKTYRETELQELIVTAEKDVTANDQKLDDMFAKQAKLLVEQLAKEFLATDSLTLE